MKITLDKSLFWFLKEDAEIDLSEPSQLDMYIQQVMTHGGADDVRVLLRKVKIKQLAEAFGRIKRFLPEEVRRFWEDFIGSTKQPSKRDTR